MQTLTLHPTSDTPSSPRLHPPLVTVDGQPRYDLHVQSWTVVPAPEFGRVVLTADDATAHQHHALPQPGRRVCVIPWSPDGLATFDGIVRRHHSCLAADDDHVTAEVEHVLADAFRPPLVGRWHATADGSRFVDGVPTRFNTSAGLSAGPTVCLNGRAVRVYAGDSSSVSPWSVADALRYLLAFALPPEAEMPTTDELLELGAGIELEPYNASGVSIGEAVCEIARRGGLALRTARTGLGVVAYRPGVDGRRTRLQLQWPGERVDPAQTNVQAADIRVSRRPARRPVRVLGRAKLYEATFSLQPGWDPAAAGDAYDAYVRSGSTDFSRVDDVFRKWVLNEHGGYDGPPWNLPRYDAAVLCASDFAIARPRRFLPCLTTDSADRSHGIVVQVRLSPADPWLQWGAAVWASDEECAIEFDGDALDADYVQAAAAGTADVRVTAALEADSLLEYALPGDRAQVTDIRHAPVGEHWTVDPSSIFFAALAMGSTQPLVLRDDTPRLQSLAERLRRTSSDGSTVRVALPWPDPFVSVGDRTESITGREIPLAASSDRHACVTRVEHDYANDCRTTLELEA